MSSLMSSLQFDAEVGDCLELRFSDFGAVNFVVLFLVAEQDKDHLTHWQRGRSPTSFDFGGDMAVLTPEVPGRSFLIRATGRWIVTARLPDGTMSATLVTKTVTRRPVDTMAF